MIITGAISLSLSTCKACMTRGLGNIPNPFTVYGYVGLGSSDVFLNKKLYKDFYRYDSTTDTWTQIPDFPGAPRTGATSFTIQNKTYVGMGQGTGDQVYKNFYAYEPRTDAWIPIAGFPKEPRYHNVTLVMDNKAYVGLGKKQQRGIYGVTKDFYRYSPRKNTWKKLADFPGRPRYNALFFTIHHKAYVGLGSGYTASPTSTDPTTGRPLNDPEASQDFYGYDFSMKKWTSLAKFPGSVLYQYPSTFNFTMYGKGYFIDLITQSFFYAYDPTLNTWTSLPGVPQALGQAYMFTICQKAYIGTDQNFYDYNPKTNLWTKLANFPGKPRLNAPVVWIIQDKAYVGMGDDKTNMLQSDFYCYDPKIDTWTRVADFPGEPRYNFTTFTALEMNEDVLRELCKNA